VKKREILKNRPNFGRGHVNISNRSSWGKGERVKRGSHELGKAKKRHLLEERSAVRVEKGGQSKKKSMLRVLRKRKTVGGRECYRRNFTLLKVGEVLFKPSSRSPKRIKKRN